MKRKTKTKRKTKNRNTKLLITIIRELNGLCSSMDISEKEMNLLVQFLMTEKALFKFESILLTVIIYSRMNLEIKSLDSQAYSLTIFGLHLSKGLINYGFNPFCLAERWVFLAFVRRLPLHKYCVKPTPHFMENLSHSTQDHYFPKGFY